MKKLIAMVAAASALAGFSATYEESVALAATPYGQITAENVRSVCEACVAVTNGWKIYEIRERGLISFTDAASYFETRTKFLPYLYRNAVASSNTELRASCYTALENAACAGDVNCYGLIYASRCGFGTTAAQRLATAKKIIAAGQPIFAIQPLLGGIPRELINGSVSSNEYYSAEYLAYCREKWPELKAAWLEAAPVLTKAGKPIDAWDDGIDVIRWQCFQKGAANDSTMTVFADKASKYVDAGQNLFIRAIDAPFYNKMRATFLASENFKEDDKVAVAMLEDKVAKNKNATIALWPKLTDDKLKINTALYLNDVDKLIDTLKTVGDKLDAKTVESIIAPLNDVNAGYRTNDLRLALANVNKKYTLKLYDDRDTWEPVLSKIRAMIDAL